MAAGDDADRAIQALRNGAKLPADASPALADFLEAADKVEVGPHPRKGWLHVSMSALDVSRCLLPERGTPADDVRRAATALREGTPFPQESGPVLATMLDKHRRLEPQPETPAEWGAEIDKGAEAVARAVVAGMT